MPTKVCLGLGSATALGTTFAKKATRVRVVRWGRVPDSQAFRCQKLQLSAPRLSCSKTQTWGRLQLRPHAQQQYLVPNSTTASRCCKGHGLGTVTENRSEGESKTEEPQEQSGKRRPKGDGCVGPQVGHVRGVGRQSSRGSIGMGLGMNAGGRGKSYLSLGGSSRCDTSMGERLGSGGCNVAGDRSG